MEVNVMGWMGMQTSCLRDTVIIFLFFTGSVQNATIEERVSLLEIQVVEIEEDVTDLDQDVNFLFEEQIIQDERLLNLEEASVQVTVELAEINVNIQGVK